MGVLGELKCLSFKRSLGDPKQDVAPQIPLSVRRGQLEEIMQHGEEKFSELGLVGGVAGNGQMMLNEMNEELNGWDMEG